MIKELCACVVAAIVVVGGFIGVAILYAVGLSLGVVILLLRNIVPLIAIATFVWVAVYAIERFAPQ